MRWDFVRTGIAVFPNPDVHLRLLISIWCIGYFFLYGIP